MSPTNTAMEEKTACINWAVLKTYLQNKKVYFHPTLSLLSLTKLTIVPGSPDSLGCKFVDGNQGFLKLFGKDHISKWLPAAILHYERGQGSYFFIEINDDLPVGQVASRKNPGEGLWTVDAKSPSENAISLLPHDILEFLKSNIKEVQDDEDTEDAIISETSADSISDGEEIVTVTRTRTRAESMESWKPLGLGSWFHVSRLVHTQDESGPGSPDGLLARPLPIGLPPSTVYCASLKSAFDSWVSETQHTWPATLAICVEMRVDRLCMVVDPEELIDVAQDDQQPIVAPPFEE
ncbi:unnamed protein product [Fusarium equiseti]|uniref:Uncharacterized protein n=1 Tax=Fusarium equiseti TaxID=61235 RepID=A0A8J2IWS4_FUSEQ|nr:unnamed protein product [Fusarium equiseti]